MLTFPDTGWDGAGYFDGEGRWLVGSSWLKLYMTSPSVYWETQTAKAAEAIGDATLYQEKLLVGPSKRTTELGSRVDELLTGEPFDGDLSEAKEAQAIEMAAYVRASRYGHFFDGRGQVAYQVPMKWVDPSGCWCRSRPDILREVAGQPMYPDLKVLSYRTWRNGRTNLRTHAMDFGADIQAALARRGAKILWGIENLACYLLVLKASAPYVISLHPWSDETIAAADREVGEALNRLHVETQHFLATGEFPVPVIGDEL